MIPIASIQLPEVVSFRSKPKVDTPALKKDGEHRDYRLERLTADAAFIDDLAAVREQAESGGLNGDKWMYLVKALLACPLPYRRITERQITRRTRFDGKWISITYTACRPNIELPYGADAKLMHWLFDRGLRHGRDVEASSAPENRVIPYRSTHEYLVDCGMTGSSENYRTVREGFRRLTGLAITVEIEANGEDAGAIIPLLDSWRLPKSIDRHPKSSQSRFEEDRYGFVLSKELYEHGRKYCMRIPRQMWRLLKGKPRKAAILLWLYTRAWQPKAKAKLSGGSFVSNCGTTTRTPASSLAR